VNTTDLCDVQKEHHHGLSAFNVCKSMFDDSRGVAETETVILAEVFNADTTPVVPIFNVFSSVSISNITFNGSFVVIEEGKILSSTSIFVVTAGNSSIDVSLTNVVLGATTSVAIGAELSEGSVLTQQSVTTTCAELIEAYVDLPMTCPSPGFSFPQVVVDNLRVVNAAYVNATYAILSRPNNVFSLTNIDLVLTISVDLVVKANVK